MTLHRLLLPTLVIGLSGSALCGCSETGHAAPAPVAPLAAVTVAHPGSAFVQEMLDYTGRIEPVQRVEVRARVSGYLAAVKFKDGQIVKVGDPLFVIDQRPFLAARDRAQANLAQAQAHHRLADAQLARTARLHQMGGVSTEDLDRARGDFDGTQAALLMTQAELRNAELDLAFTTVAAPISGRVSDHRVDIGSYVTGGTAQSDLLTTVVALDFARATVDLSEADFRRLSRLPRFPTWVNVRMDGTPESRRADIDFIDNEASSRSGTVRLRARLDNHDRALMPGYFARVEIPVDEAAEHLTVPDAAVQSDQAGKLVWLVDDRNKVVPRMVQVGQLLGERRVVLSGLALGDRVIVGGAQRVRPGDEVRPVGSAKGA